MNAPKEVFSTRVDSATIRGLKHLAIDLHKSIGALLEEAIQDLLKKYEYQEAPKPKKIALKSKNAETGSKIRG